MTNPQLITTPFAENGTKNTIPESGSAEPQLATMQAGFPEITQRPISDGGIPPERADFNGILNLYGQHLVHLSKGLPYEFDQDFANSIGGYPLNARIMLSSGEVVQNTQEGNTNNPNIGMGGWKSRAVSKDVTVPTYKTTADGVNPVTGVADGAYFNVRSEDDDTVAVEYQNVGGSAVATGKIYASGNAKWPASSVYDNSGKNQQSVNDEQRLKTQYVTIQMFTGANDHEKFLNAIASNKNILVVAGDYTINNSDITKMLTPKNGQFIHFEDGARIFFNFNGMPLFNCINSSGGGLTGFPEFIFTGTSQTTDSYTKAQYLSATGLSDIVLGGNQELRSVIMRVNCTNHKLFDSVHFHSAINDTDHGICFCINDKGDMTNYVDGNRIGDCIFENHIHGILVAAQRNFKIGNMVSQKRWSHPSVAPGHVLYLTGAITNGYLKDGTIGTINDLGNSLDENVAYNLAPLAPKGCINVQFGSIVSHHYSGLIQSLSNCSDCTFEKMIWRYNGTNTDTQPHVNISGGTSTNITLDIEVDAPNVAFKYSETSDTQLNNSTVKAKIRCKQQPSASSSANSQMFRSSSNGTDYDIDWTPTSLGGTYYVLPFEEINGITATNKNTVRLMLRGDNLIASSTRVITRADTSVYISSEKPITRDITFQPYTDFAKRTFNTNVYKYNKAGVSTSGAWVETFQMPADGMFILSLSAYVSGGNGHSSAWLLNYTPTLGIYTASQIASDQNTATPKVTITSIAVSPAGLVTLTFNKTTADSSTLNVNLTRIGTMF